MKLVILGVLFVLAGCAVTPPPTWTKDGGTEAQFNEDKAQCEYDVVKYAGQYDTTRNPLIAAQEASDRRRELGAACMRSKGYRVATQEDFDRAQRDGRR